MEMYVEKILKIDLSIAIRIHLFSVISLDRTLKLGSFQHEYCDQWWTIGKYIFSTVRSKNRKNNLSSLAFFFEQLFRAFQIMSRLSDEDETHGAKEESWSPPNRRSWGITTILFERKENQILKVKS